MSTRVLRLIARLNIGGPAIHATLLTSGLDPQRYESLLVHGREAADEGNYLKLSGLSMEECREIPALGRDISPVRDAAAYRDVVRLIRRYRPMIVHTHTAKAGVVGRLAAWRAGVPILVHTYHGHVFHDYFSTVRTRMFVEVERQLARVTHRLVTVSDTVRDEILDCGIGRPEQFDVIRLGLNLDPFVESDGRAGELRRSLDLPAGARTVGIVARLVPIKAHEVFLAMAKRVAAEHPEVVFLVIGDGECRRDLEAFVRDQGLAARVRFLGWQADLGRIYAGLDVVVLTSRNEGSPVALIEAMAAARPVVATRAGGVAELVGAAGLLADVGDDAELARQVSRVLAEPALAADLGARARRRVVPAYSRERLIRDVDALYQRLIVAHGSS
jgi:glycosyltransferase involved in cell wall biosynthesis